MEYHPLNREVPKYFIRFWRLRRVTRTTLIWQACEISATLVEQRSLWLHVHLLYPMLCQSWAVPSSGNIPKLHLGWRQAYRFECLPSKRFSWQRFLDFAPLPMHFRIVPWSVINSAFAFEVVNMDAVHCWKGDVCPYRIEEQSDL